MSVTVAPGLENGDLALTVDTQEAMGIADGLHGIDRDVEATVGAVLKPTADESPLAISLWVCDSVVRAPMADQLIRS